MDQKNKKVRIQLLTEDGVVITDRLVNQGIEFTTGPKVSHKGPFRIEFNLEDQKDVKLANEYISKLSGLLPIEAKKKHTKKAIVADFETPDQREEFIKECIKLGEDSGQEALINFLRDKGFTLLAYDFLKLVGIGDFIKEKHQKNYHFMVKRLRKAKDPLNDRLDPLLLWGFKMGGKKSTKVVIYAFNKLHSIQNFKHGDVKLKSLEEHEVLEFPHFMVEEERAKFSKENRELVLDPEKKKSKFFQRWEPYVKKGFRL